MQEKVQVSLNLNSGFGNNNNLFRIINKDIQEKQTQELPVSITPPVLSSPFKIVGKLTWDKDQLQREVRNFDKESSSQQSYEAQDMYNNISPDQMLNLHIQKLPFEKYCQLMTRYFRNTDDIEECLQGFMKIPNEAQYYQQILNPISIQKIFTWVQNSRFFKIFISSLCKSLYYNDLPKQTLKVIVQQSKKNPQGYQRIAICLQFFPDVCKLRSIIQTKFRGYVLDLINSPNFVRKIIDKYHQPVQKLQQKQNQSSNNNSNSDSNSIYIQSNQISQINNDQKTQKQQQFQSQKEKFFNLKRTNKLLLQDDQQISPVNIILENQISQDSQDQIKDLCYMRQKNNQLQLINFGLDLQLSAEIQSTNLDYWQRQQIKRQKQLQKQRQRQKQKQKEQDDDLLNKTFIPNDDQQQTQTQQPFNNNNNKPHSNQKLNFIDALYKILTTVHRINLKNQMKKSNKIYDRQILKEINYQLKENYQYINIKKFIKVTAYFVNYYSYQFWQAVQQSSAYIQDIFVKGLRMYYQFNENNYSDIQRMEIQKGQVLILRDQIFLILSDLLDNKGSKNTVCKLAEAIIKFQIGADQIDFITRICWRNSFLGRSVIPELIDSIVKTLQNTSISNLKLNSKLNSRQKQKSQLNQNTNKTKIYDKTTNISLLYRLNCYKLIQKLLEVKYNISPIKFKKIINFAFIQKQISKNALRGLIDFIKKKYQQAQLQMNQNSVCFYKKYLMTFSDDYYD